MIRLLLLAVLATTFASCASMDYPQETWNLYQTTTVWRVDEVSLEDSRRVTATMDEVGWAKLFQVHDIAVQGRNLPKPIHVRLLDELRGEIGGDIDFVLVEIGGSYHGHYYWDGDYLGEVRYVDIVARAFRQRDAPSVVAEGADSAAP